MKIRTIVGLLLVFALVLGSTGVGAAVDCPNPNCPNLECPNPECPIGDCIPNEYLGSGPNGNDRG